MAALGIFPHWPIPAAALFSLSVAMQKAADGDTVCERVFRTKCSVQTENVILIPGIHGEDALGSIRPAKENVISLKTPGIHLWQFPL